MYIFLYLNFDIFIDVLTGADENIDMGLCLTRNGAKIQVDVVPPGVLEKVDLFYVCEDCGKVYWDGSHFEKVLSGRLQGIVLS